ncbi:hypothetical protein EW146_g3725 [Bondarzewia mesenterica]|uniref:AB hydrolase-1 domain-containing protein n=1 Tax=Bondarzewia mesenterica TaxID=1095465 RepID=A0A4V3XFC7_9AGAM|nr:hypothetical protein EW146_g3725 [Bondarzewia mesenterica]
MSERQSTKISIPHTFEDGVSIVGVLEQLEPAQFAVGRKIALKRLALRLPLDSFRFDFRCARCLSRFYASSVAFLMTERVALIWRGAHESGGGWVHSGIGRDVEDLRVVVDHLTRHYGYEVDLLVGHSRGSVVAMHWLCTSEEGKRVGGIVNASGRYRMHRIFDNAHRYQTSFDERGYYDWEVVVARKRVIGRIYPADLERFASWDTSIVWDKFPQNTDMLSVHGLTDKVVPPYVLAATPCRAISVLIAEFFRGRDILGFHLLFQRQCHVPSSVCLLRYDAMIYSRAVGGRDGGTHNLHYVDGADHNFTGVRLCSPRAGFGASERLTPDSCPFLFCRNQQYDEVVDTILEWWDMHQRGQLRTGIWQTGIRGKL